MRAFAGFGLNMLLARLLGPEPFGVVAVAMVVIALATLVVESGLSVQLIQRKTISTTVIRGVFTIQLLFGFVLSAGVLLSTPLIVALLKQDSVRPVLQALAFVLVIVSAGQTSTALLRRELRFRALQTIQTVSYVIGYGAVGIPLAISGAGVWALVWAQLTQATFCTAATWALVRHSLVPYVGPESTNLLRFGSVLASSNVVSWSIGAIPTFLIGRTLGPLNLGLYNRAFMLVGVPLTALASSLQTVSLSLYSRLQDDATTIRRAFLGIVALVGLVAFPCFLLVAGAASTVIRAVLGSRWAEAGPILLPLALAMPFDAIAAISSSLLISRGRPDLDLRAQVITAISGALSLAAVSVSSPSMSHVVWTVCVCFYVIRAATTTLFVRRLLGIHWRAYARAISGGVLAGLVALLATAIAGSWLTPLAAGPRLLLAWAAGAGSALSAIVLFPSIMIGRDMAWLLSGRGLPLPGFVEQWLQSNVSPRSRTVAL